MSPKHRGHSDTTCRLHRFPLEVTCFLPTAQTTRVYGFVALANPVSVGRNLIHSCLYRVNKGLVCEDFLIHSRSVNAE